MEPSCQPFKAVLEELDVIAPDAPFLALGQTVFWDEPMKGGVSLQARALGSKRRLIAGIHDTDYFAKLPRSKVRSGSFKTFPHNDTTTKGLWSAAGEFSTLFGSETVITKEALQAAGLRTAKLQAARPGYLDQATEAWGWRGIVSLEDPAPITAQVKLDPVFRELHATFDWALNTTVESLRGASEEAGKAKLNEIHADFCGIAEGPSQSLSNYYESLIPSFYKFTAGVEVDLETTRTTRLLTFNTKTCHLPRFEIAGLFAAQSTRAEAARAYDESLQGPSGVYELSKFGTGAIPFDLIIPDEGRGTIRLGTRGAVIMTRRPQFLSFKKPIESIAELAAAIEAKFGKECVLVGKAVSLIGMLAREHIFVFHEGASSYVQLSKKFHQLLRDRLGFGGTIHPILRIRYRAWDALEGTCSWFRLPEPFQHAFGTEELCSPSFAQRWRSVVESQKTLLKELGRLRRPTELIDFLDSTHGGAWKTLAQEYRSLHDVLALVQEQVDATRKSRDHLYNRRRQLKVASVTAEHALGDHFRAHIFGVTPTAEAIAERGRLEGVLHEVRRDLHHLKQSFIELRVQQQEVVQDPKVLAVHERRRAIELEAELKRLRLVRDAIISSQGLERASLRPGAWWFPIVSPDGKWYRQTIESADYYLEHLI